jgi:hypothetical protein
MTAYLLNLADLAFTLYALCHGAYELNPLMRNIPFQCFYKAVLVGVLLWWLSTRQERLARVGYGVCTAVFAAVDVWHIVNIAACLAA